MCKCIRIGIFVLVLMRKKKKMCQHHMRNPFLAKTNKFFSGVVCTSTAAPIDRSNKNNTNNSNRIVCLIAAAIPIDCSSDNKNNSSKRIIPYMVVCPASTAPIDCIDDNNIISSNIIFYGCFIIAATQIGLCHKHFFKRIICFTLFLSCHSNNNGPQQQK